MSSFDIDDICYHKEIHVMDKLQFLFLLPTNLEKGISQINKKPLVFLFTLHSFFFGATRIQINAFLS